MPENTRITSVILNKKNLIVYNSSAGSGKTFTLVRHYLSLALKEENPHHFKKILAMTFTNKAANEMKERVLQHLYALSRESASEAYNHGLIQAYIEFTELSEEKLQAKSEIILKHILHNYSDLSLLTIDKFMQRLVRSFTQELDLPFDLEIEPNFSNIASSGIRNILNEAGNDGELSEVLTSYYLHTADDEKDINSLEKNLIDFSKTLENERSSNQIGALLKLNTEDFKSAHIKLTAYLSEINKKITETGVKIKHLLDIHGYTESSFFYGKTGIYSLFKKIMNFEGGVAQFSEIFLNKNALKTLDENKWAGSSLPEDYISSEFKEQITCLIKEVLKLCNSERTRYVLYSDLESQIYRLMMLKEIALQIADIKEENNLIFFNDFHRYVAEIIRNEPVSFIYERSGDRYQNLLLDEFQDTSELQWENLIPLIDNGIASGNLNLIVGDAKQAIYRFRNGNVKQFVQLPIIGSPKVNFPQSVQDNFKREFSSRNLAVNRRSSPEIVSFNNLVFKNIRDTALSANLMPYYQDCAQEVGTKITDGYVCCHILEDSSKNNEDEDEETNIQASFRITLSQIKECIEDGYEPGDITILLRSKNQIAQFANTLMKEGIKVVSEEGLKLIENKEVKTITAILKLLVNPFSKSSALNVLLHFHSEKELPELVSNYFKKAEKRMIYFDIDDYFNAYIPELSTKELLTKNLHDLISELGRVLRFNPDTNPFLEGMLDAILDFSQQHGDNLFSFLDWWNEAGNKRSAIVPKSRDAVELVTIHKSKGLQYPVVICPMVSWKPHSGNVAMELVDISAQLDGIPAALINLASKKLEGTDFESLLKEETENIILDNLNLLYVALTRPERRMYLTVFAPKESIKKEYPSHAGWLTFKGLGLAEFPTAAICFGQRAKKSPTETHKTTVIPTATNKLNWQSVVKVVSNYPEIEQAPRHYGNLLHLALEKVKTKTDVDTAIKSIIKDGWLNDADCENFKSELNKIVFDPQLEPWFDEHKEIFCEQEVVTREGRLIRIDRMIKLENSIIPLDFKTGEERSKDKKQMINYLNELNQCGYNTSKGFVYYTHSQQLVEVIL
ncbi:MAG: UvrD-helicase domain-containing protein [Flavobacteriales bacterium]